MLHHVIVYSGGHYVCAVAICVRYTGSMDVKGAAWQPDGHHGQHQTQNVNDVGNEASLQQPHGVVQARVDESGQHPCGPSQSHHHTSHGLGYAITIDVAWRQRVLEGMILKCFI